MQIRISEEFMTEETKKEPKRRKIEPGIHQNPDNSYDVRVSRRVELKKGEPTKQLFKRTRSVVGLGNAQKEKRKLLDELAREAQKYEGSDLIWEDALLVYFKYLEKRHAENNLAFSTKDSIITALNKHTKHWSKKWLSEFTGDFIESFISSDKLKDIVQTETRLTILKHIRGVFKRMVQIGKMKHNPAMGLYVRGRKKLRYPTVMKHEEIVRLIIHAEKIDQDWAGVYKVAYLTGARSGELYALKWEDIDFGTKTIRIRHSYDWKTEKIQMTKGKKDRTVPMNSSLIECLLGLRGKHDPFVLPRIRDWKNGKSAQIFRAHQEALGIKQSKFHAIRGTFITNLLINGVPVIKVQSIVGHDDLKTTLLYVGMLGEDNKGATDSLSLETGSLIDIKTGEKIPS